MALLDTTPTAEKLQLAIQRRLTAAARLLIALDMSEVARDLAVSAMRMRFPNSTDAELRRELLRQAFRPGALPAPLR